MSIARDGKNGCNVGSSSEPSIYCPVRVSAIFHVAGREFLQIFLGVLANDL
jgi:hypothetical protein